MSELTHIDERGSARMVSINEKKTTQRRAVALANITLSPETLTIIQEGKVPKGDVFAVARVAGIMAAKETSRLIPLCHPLKLTGITVDFVIDEVNTLIKVEACVEALDQTGVEMEALTAVNIACLTLYDMLKAVDQHMVISDIKVVHKSGGKRDFDSISDSNTKQNPPRQANSSLLERPGGSIPSAHAGLGRSIKVVGKGSAQPSVEVEEIATIVDQASSGLSTSTLIEPPVEEQDELMASCEKPFVKLLTPLEPISSSLNLTNKSRTQSSNEHLGQQVSQSESDSEQSDVDTDLSVWEESMLAESIDHEGVMIPSVSEYAQQHALRVREVSLTHQPLQEFIIKRPVECAYLLGYLSPAFTQRARAFILEDEQDTSSTENKAIKALLFIYSGLTVPTIWTYGSELDVESILYAVHNELPRRIYLNVEDHHYHAIRSYYSLRAKREILRMGLERSLYQPIGDSEGVVALGHPDTGAIMSLFQRYYPDNLFEPAQLESGLYCGIKDEQGRLLSVAGIHLLNPDYRVAAIGNIVTDSSCRGKGYATKCVRHILDQLFTFVDSVALNVIEDNMPAIYCYKKFGFQTTARLIEAQARLR